MSEERNEKDSKEIVSELKQILNKAAASSISFPDYKDRDRINENSKKLSFEEMAELLIHFYSYPGTITYDAAGLFEANIRIDDRRSVTGRNFPLAYVEFTDGINSHIEVIDILESVKSDAALIGHPVIAYAIYHWQKILAWGKFKYPDNVYSDDEFQKWLNHTFSGVYIESARENLEAIGKAILEGVKNQTVPKEVALTLKIKSLKIPDKDTFLYVAWDRLALKHINETDNFEKRLEKIESFLRQLPTKMDLQSLENYEAEFRQYEYVDTTISISTVIDFLRTAGSKYVYHPSSFHNQRPRWTVFHKAFARWYFRKSGTTVEQYEKKANQLNFNETPYQGSIDGVSMPVNLFHFSSHILTKPLKKYCAPIECDRNTAYSHRFSDLVTQTDTK